MQASSAAVMAATGWAIRLSAKMLAAIGQASPVDFATLSFKTDLLVCQIAHSQFFFKTQCSGEIAAKRSAYPLCEIRMHFSAKFSKASGSVGTFTLIFWATRPCNFSLMNWVCEWSHPRSAGSRTGRATVVGRSLEDRPDLV
jgi:hypothetical protein